MSLSMCMTGSSTWPLHSAGELLVFLVSATAGVSSRHGVSCWLCIPCWECRRVGVLEGGAAQGAGPAPLLLPVISLQPGRAKGTQHVMAWPSVLIS